MRHFISSSFIVLLFSFFTLQAFAQEAPDALLERITGEVVVELKQKSAELKRNPSAVYPIVNRIIVPYIDWQTMAQWVIGRQAWTQATPSQRTRFASEFKDLMIRTYSSTLRAYDNQVIEYFPIRGGYEGKARVQVSSVIKAPGKESVQVTYRLIAKGDTWKVYDISIEGVSLLKGFQAQFASEVQQSGLDALITRLSQHNDKPLK